MDRKQGQVKYVAETGIHLKRTTSKKYGLQDLADHFNITEGQAEDYFTLNQRENKMKENFKDCLSMLLKHEGGFVDHPKDPGGATNKGVTKKVYDEYLGRECTIDELKNIPMDHVEEIYKKNYWDKVKGDDLPNGVDFSIL